MKVTIERLGHRGEGMARGPDGAPVFVPMTLPGEEIEGECRDGRIEAPRILRSSPHRVRPDCPHYRACGGCALMHADDGFVAEWKTDVVRAALAAQGLEAAFRPTVTVPANSRRRATLAGRRTKKGAIVGFHARASDTIVAVPECRLLHPDLVALIPRLEELVVAGASRKAELDLTLTRSDAGVDLSVRGGKPLAPELFSALAAFAERADLARLSWNGEPVAARRPATFRMGDAVVVPPPGAFLQASAEAESALVRAVAEAVGSARRITDLFCGVGTFSLPLARGADILAVEGDAEMIAALQSAWRATPGLHQLRAEARDLFRRPLLPDELGQFDAVVIDPPRAGAEAQSRELARSGIAVVAAVSCNPVTFARDARILCDAGFRIDWVQVVDQFRWSPHVELVARLVRG